MTVLENVLVGAHTVSRFESERSVRATRHEMLEYVGIDEVAGRPRPGSRSARSSASSSPARSSRSRGSSCSTSPPAG